MTHDATATPDDDGAEQETDPCWFFALPRIGRRTTRWFALRLRELLVVAAYTRRHSSALAVLRLGLATHFGADWRSLTPESLTLLAKWYAADPERYLLFYTASTCAGHGAPIGAYRIAWEKVVGDLPVALFQFGVPLAPTSRAAPANTPEGDENTSDGQGDVSGSARLPSVVRDSLRSAASQRRARWPRSCRTCGESFTPSRANSRRCVACRRGRDARGSSDGEKQPS